ncbi:Protein of unknown function, partial [Gryllus bimaculatus]
MAEKRTTAKDTAGADMASDAKHRKLFTAEIQQIGRENFLKERPHLSYVGVNDTNNANVVLIYKLKDLFKPKVWANIK